MFSSNVVFSTQNFLFRILSKKGEKTYIFHVLLLVLQLCIYNCFVIFYIDFYANGAAFSREVHKSSSRMGQFTFCLMTANRMVTFNLFFIQCFH